MAEFKYLTYPFKVMRITQIYGGTTSHKPHTTGNIKDYPIDEGGKDSGRDPMYAPCDLVVKRIYGVGTQGTNTVWLESTDKVVTPSGTDYVTIMATHSNDSDLKNLKVGDKIKKNIIVCYEGTDGATGNHIHLSVALGKMEGSGWKQNSNGKWVLTGTGKELKPEEAFFIDKDFTTVKSDGGLKFKELPKDENTGDDDMTRGYFKKGDRNEGVYAYKQLLIALKKAGVIEQSVDNNNVFGAGCVTATEQVQAAAGLTQDGYAGKETIRACYTLLAKKIK